jgi:threonyl-tRNA synthetase
MSEFSSSFIRTELQAFMQEQLRKRGYSPVFSPHIGNIELYKTSGHYPYYKNSQYPPIRILSKEDNRIFACHNCGHLDEEVEEEYILKPMNCPHHCMMFRAMPRSYRDLPLRLAEFGTVYRYEAPGSLLGMMRVRGLTQDDAHIFCTPEQVAGEVRDTIRLTKLVLDTLGLADFRTQLSLRDPNDSKYVGDKQTWDMAEGQLRDIVKDAGLQCEEKRGEAAFYGPKLDFMVNDAGGRERQLGTVQLDYSLPGRFGLEYTGSDGLPHRPIMIHRAPFGSFERFVAVLIEHFNGAFPTWLSPVQVRVVNITAASEVPAKEFAETIRTAGIRVDEDIAAHGNVNQRVKDFELARIPYLAVIGAREITNGTVTARTRMRIPHDMANGLPAKHSTVTIDEFIRMVRTDIDERNIEPGRIA